MHKEYHARTFAVGRHYQVTQWQTDEIEEPSNKGGLRARSS